jgi:hypothetical protein
MAAKHNGKKSDWRSIGMALIHVGALFVPVALSMLILAGIAAHAPPHDVDPVQTGSVDQR